PKSVPEATDSSEERFFSVVSVWEIALKASLKKLLLPQPAGAYISGRMESFGLQTLLLSRHAVAVESLPFHHRDPFDRMLISQAIAEALTMLTVPRVFKRYAGLRSIPA
ncbi:MAG: type II toxin-antitoxin system VapC family toxin, partial [Candidatus Cybelea sp.]